MQPPMPDSEAHLRAEDRREPKNGHKRANPADWSPPRGAVGPSPMASIAAGHPPLRWLLSAPHQGLSGRWRASRIFPSDVWSASASCGLATTDLLNCRSVLAGHPTALRLAGPTTQTAPWACSSMGTTPILCPKQPTGRSAERSTCWISTWAAPSTRCAKKMVAHSCCAIPNAPCDWWSGFGGGSGRVPVTAKLRLGWDDDHLTGPRLAQMLESVGIAAIAIHGRTTEMKFRGQVRLKGLVGWWKRFVISRYWAMATQVSRRCRTHDAPTGCDGVMLARAAARQPWLLSRIHQLLEHGEDPGNWTTMAC